ncbi:hypothetical protein AA103196_0409 [Ameyamaea chiangmaiensis NBRC 103196]|uniref:Glycosyl hydrolase family 36 N-terminal domain-containing protein n=1 Tax=Ameyamaea chiangmaiensis TaxID=442969 RepID=A0A850P7R1_9PROT|nr:glycoside hydrolase family 36 N-terminal domain-containing protein [Ameyamaea chiangmaiensis]MBS4074805.1 hypothetical protein [Ameyamaea chiangmaiensis]NVN40637.1 hypothetical protein [Ameyamaea chiangmaiensis]GBQ62799.1 hypothetical protein AA103196_0409 [Ameyamaea chiangmaiensis NBRC 103196]
MVESRRNRAHDHFPALAATTDATAANAGEAWAFLLGWSGSHRLAAERMEDGRFRVSLGEWLYPGEMRLRPGETYAAAPAYAVFSRGGTAGIARPEVSDWLFATISKQVDDWRIDYIK